MCCEEQWLSGGLKVGVFPQYCLTLAVDWAVNIKNQSRIVQVQASVESIPLYVVGLNMHVGPRTGQLGRSAFTSQQHIFLANLTWSQFIWVS